MGGKAKRRREKNFLKAHGGYEPLAPPPSSKDIDAVPSKLRQIMQFMDPDSSSKNSTFHKGSTNGASLAKKPKVEARPLKAPAVNGASLTKKPKIEARPLKAPAVFKDTSLESEHEIDGISDSEKDEKKSRRKKRKRGEPLLQLLESENVTSTNRKRERRKKFMEDKKKKKSKNHNSFNEFPQHEIIKFGEVVSAPPKLVFPKKHIKELKIRQDVSQERVRLQTIERYRNRKGWAARPGNHVPPPINVEESSALHNE